MSSSKCQDNAPHASHKNKKEESGAGRASAEQRLEMEILGIAGAFKELKEEMKEMQNLMSRFSLEQEGKRSRTKGLAELILKRTIWVGSAYNEMAKARDGLSSEYDRTEDESQK